MHLHRAALATTAALTVALLAPVATAQTAPATTGLKASYTCQITHFFFPDAEPFPLDVDAQVSAVRTDGRVDLELSMGRPVLAVEDTLEDVRLDSSLSTDINGTAATLTGGGTVTLGPGLPVDLPVLTGSLTTTASALTLTPGPLTVTVTVATFKVPMECTTTAGAVTVPVTDPGATPAPDRVTKKAPTLKVSLTKKSQRVRKAPAKVKVVVGRASGTTVAPKGRIRVTVGKRTVTTKAVAGARTLKVALPRNLKVGRHTVRVVFTPTAGTVYKKAARTVRIRVRR